MSSTLETIIELDRATSELEQLERALEGVPEWMEELHGEHTEQKSQVDAVHEEADEAARERRAAEADAEASKEQLKHYQEQVRQVRTQREYSALLQEIDTVKEEIRTAEESALEALERQEGGESRLAEAREEFSDLDQRYREALEEWEDQKPEERQRAAELRERVEDLRESLPPTLLSQYERIRERHGGQALVSVRRVERSAGSTLWTCEACSYQVRPQSVVAIRRALEGSHEGVVMCDGCRRILYLEEVMA